MRKNKNLQSEEDVRTKIVFPWLRDHGFSLSDLSIEFSFDIRGGRSRLRVENGELVKPHPLKSSAPSVFRPRADILVRGNNDKNLLIVEVKAPGEPLDDEARDQGCLYARALLNGNIAPIVVLTNGSETKIFDSITKEEIDGASVDRDYLYSRAEFHVGGDDLQLRTEALEALISMSPENLIAFCNVQSLYRMGRLRGLDLNAGKKYVPELYVERIDAQEELQDMLERKRCPVVVIIGSPQVGKTNLICHMVEERLARGEPTLFYPAIGVRNSLLQEVSEDFEAVFGQVNTPRQFLHKLRKVLRQVGKKLVIFIDGWNEADVHLARVIDDESERLSSDEIQIVISMTNVAASRLLKDNAGNPSFIAQAASISGEAAQLLEVKPEANRKIIDWSVIVLGNYTLDERDLAYEKYARAYNVVVSSNHKKTVEPYILGIAMNLYRGSTLPDALDEPELIEKYIYEKINRAVGLDGYEPRRILCELAREMFAHDAPVSQNTAAHVCGLSVAQRIPSGLFESGLLAEVPGGECVPAVDFYYGRDRDFAISYWAQNWRVKILNQTDITFEFDQAIRTYAGQEALRWFFKQPKHIELLESQANSLPLYENPFVRRVLLSSLCDIASRGLNDRRRWLEHAVDRATHDPEMIVRVEAARLLSLLTENEDDLLDVIDNDSLEDFVIGLLSIGEELPLEVGSVGQVVMDALRRLHTDMCSEPMDGSSISSILEDLMDNESRCVRVSAATCFGYAAPYIFLDTLAKRVRSSELHHGDQNATDFVEGFHYAVSEIEDGFYGSYGCPGYFNILSEDEELRSQEYQKLGPILEAVIFLYKGDQDVAGLEGLLKDLEPEKEGYSKPSLDLLTLPLPFDEKDS